MIPYEYDNSIISKSSNNMQECKNIVRIDAKSNYVGIETLLGDIKTLGDDVQADLMIFLLDENDKAMGEKRFLFYNQLGDVSEGVYMPAMTMWGCPRTSDFAFISFDSIPDDVTKVKLFLHLYQPQTIEEKLFFDYFNFIRYRFFISDSQGHLNDEPNSTILQKDIGCNRKGCTILEMGYFIKKGNHWDYYVDENGYDDDLNEYINCWYSEK